MGTEGKEEGHLSRVVAGNTMVRVLVPVEHRECASVTALAEALNGVVRPYSLLPIA